MTTTIKTSTSYNEDYNNFDVRSKAQQQELFKLGYVTSEMLNIKAVAHGVPRYSFAHLKNGMEKIEVLALTGFTEVADYSKYGEMKAKEIYRAGGKWAADTTPIYVFDNEIFLANIEKYKEAKIITEKKYELENLKRKQENQKKDELEKLEYQNKRNDALAKAKTEFTEVVRKLEGLAGTDLTTEDLFAICFSISRDTYFLNYSLTPFFKKEKYTEKAFTEFKAKIKKGNIKSLLCEFGLSLI